jgi:hypothetical protein
MLQIEYLKEHSGKSLRLGMQKNSSRISNHFFKSLEEHLWRVGMQYARVAAKNLTKNDVECISTLNYTLPTSKPGNCTLLIPVPS